ncbi:T-cell ecto-ADP-ribosyltransferase 2-like isoform X2 [Stigmatopora argus]
MGSYFLPGRKKESPWVIIFFSLVQVLFVEEFLAIFAGIFLISYIGGLTKLIYARLSISEIMEEKMIHVKKEFLAIFAMLYWTVSANKRLDMAPNAVDILYEGCEKKSMEKLIQSDVLSQELSNDIGFEVSWSDKCSTLLPGGVKEHTSALLAYATGNKGFKKAFNDEVETMGVNASTYEDHFHYKALHFLLTNAMSLTSPKTCRNVYRVSESPYEVKKDARVRFGRFTTVQSDLSMKEDVEGGTYFNITTCFFFNLEGFCGLTEDTAILSPAEEFTVKDVRQPEDADYTEVILTHSNLMASLGCEALSRAPADHGPQWLVMMLVSFFLLMTFSHDYLCL